MIHHMILVIYVHGYHCLTVFPGYEPLAHGSDGFPTHFLRLPALKDSSSHVIVSFSTIHAPNTNNKQQTATFFATTFNDIQRHPTTSNTYHEPLGDILLLECTAGNVPSESHPSFKQPIPALVSVMQLRPKTKARRPRGRTLDKKQRWHESLPTSWTNPLPDSHLLNDALEGHHPL